MPPTIISAQHCVVQNVIGCQSKQREIGVRQVTPIAPRVFTHVAKDVCELHGDAKGTCVFHSASASFGAVGYTENMSAHFTNGTRNTLTIQFQLLPVFVLWRTQ